MNSVLAVTIFCFCMLSIITMITGLRLAIVEGRFISWLKKNKYERWRYLTSIRLPLVGEIGPGMANSFRARKYYNSDIDNEIREVLEFKNKLARLENSTKNYMIATLVFLGMFVLLILGGVR